MIDPGAPSGPLLLAAKSLSDVMEDRSPGRRIEGQLTKVKGKQRALAKVEEPPPEEFVEALTGTPVLPEVTEEPPVLAKLEPLDVNIPPGVFVVPPDEDRDEPPGNPIPVPEPGTWASMLMGFGAIGMAIRFRRRQRIASPLQVA